MTLPDQPEKPNNNGRQDQHDITANISPIVPGRQGRPSFSLEALRERIERQFKEETANRADILLDLDTESKRRAMLSEIADYILALENITLAFKDRLLVIDKAYRNLFAFGPLDEYLENDAVTEITINGPHDIHVRRGMSRLQPVTTAFDDRAHLVGILERVLATGGAVLSDNEPFAEIGVVLSGRAARISLIGPPVSPDYSLQIRLHPHQPISLDDLHTRFRAVPPQAADLLRAILHAGYGLLIVGDAGLGKTTLAGALAHVLPTDTSIIAVERATEMHLPPEIKRRAVIPATPDNPGSDLVAQMQAALEDKPDWLIVDEIRGDESAAVWDALTRPDPPRYLWVFRGDSQADRLRSALSMVIRKAQPTIEQAAIHRMLAERLPFVAALKLVDGTPRLHMIAEWILTESAHDIFLILRPLLSEQEGGWLFIENRASRPLNLPENFWE